MKTQFVVAVLTVLLAAVLTTVSYMGHRAYQHERGQARGRVAKLLEGLSSSLSLSLVGDAGTPGAAYDRGTADLLEAAKHELVNTVAASPGLSETEAREQIDGELKALGDRVRNIETRFPEVGSKERTASVNEALLAERIDQLAKRLDRLEERTLTRWQVAMVVGTMIGAIVFVVGGVVAVLAYFGKRP